MYQFFSFFPVLGTRAVIVPAIVPLCNIMIMIMIMIVVGVRNNLYGALPCYFIRRRTSWLSVSK